MNITNIRSRSKTLIIFLLLNVTEQYFKVNWIPSDEFSSWVHLVIANFEGFSHQYDHPPFFFTAARSRAFTTFTICDY